jgi:hypothetical protein
MVDELTGMLPVSQLNRAAEDHRQLFVRDRD